MKVKNTMGFGRQNKNRATQNESFNKNSKKSEEMSSQKIKIRT